MFSNEPGVFKSDKDRLISLLTEAKDIIDYYPWSVDFNCHTVTNMSRAKHAIQEAYEWVRYLREFD